ncbi:MAG TPA: SDR family NAD(P)-dependent oxidoreductase [Acetobacteraceae bacterium]|nr:SDR family NAD(P)-dependent oxidoreductase [Acetobacteraceae bacterium]
MKKRNPLAPLNPPLLPPSARSRAALGLTAAAARGAFQLQVCTHCDAVQYPPRDVCHACLCDALVWRAVPDGGRVLAETTVRISADPYFRTKAPWRVGMVALDCGPSVIAHLHADMGAGQRVRMSARLDKSGQAVMLALPEGSTDLSDDRQLRELACDPRGRRVLVTDIRSPFGCAISRAMADAGAQVLDGIGLDVTDTENVRRAAGAYGGRVEILVNTTLHIRPGGVIGRGDVVLAHEEIETTQLGLMRLAQSFGPALRGRGAEKPNAACAWVNIFSVYGLIPDAAFGAASAVHAAALSLSRTLRAELRAGGIRVIDVFVGPLDDVWHEAQPPPKVSPSQLAAAVVRALRDGVEEVAVGDVAQDVLARYRDDPKVLERELSGRPQ